MLTYPGTRRSLFCVYNICWMCNSAEKAKESKPLKPAHMNAWVSKTDPERIQEQRLNLTKLERALSEMRVKLEKSSMKIDNELSNDSENPRFCRH